MVNLGALIRTGPNFTPSERPTNCFSLRPRSGTSWRECHHSWLSPVGAYSFGVLIGEAHKVFGHSLCATLPEKVLSDFKAAGACLAFDQGTACGFHVYRATDAMLRAYCNHFGAVPKGTGRDWGRYIQTLGDLKKQTPLPAKMPNERTVKLLDAIREKDRNPLIHPELDLTPEEALGAFDMCKVAVTFMAQEMV